MEPTTAAMIAKAAIAVGTNKKVWTGIDFRNCRFVSAVYPDYRVHLKHRIWRGRS